ncbi:HNH endonuclease [Bacteroidales bacterium 6E]|nr:HNH endonuclease [Bacteroidales bacterium 6E]
MKKILGLDLGTNSIGWALVNVDKNGNPFGIEGLGSRIIPMDQATLSDFEKGNSKSQTAERTMFRGARRLRERKHLRRERLHRILNELNFLPIHYRSCIDFVHRLGKFKANHEPKIAWRSNDQDKMEFIFQNSFLEMMSDFTKRQPELVKEGKKIPYDWTIYFLRKKALGQRIEKEELAWLLLHFNQKRGYYQLRGEDEIDATRSAKTRKYFDRKIIKSIIDTGEEYKGLKVLIVELDNGNQGKIFKQEVPDWVGQEKNIIATVDLDKDGKDRFDKGVLSQRFSIPSDSEWETEWKLIKLKTEEDLEASQKTVGTYIYDSLLKNPNQKIKGKLVRTIERKYYRDELRAILNKQREFHPELNDKKLYQHCIFSLYPQNEAFRNSIANKDFTYLFLEDIIFYQRPLKSKKSTINNCAYEVRRYMDKETKELKEVPLKCIAKSHPIFQEFRLWQFISNLRIYKKDITDIDVTNDFLHSQDDYANLFEWLNNKNEIDQKAFLKYPAFGFKKDAVNYRWNYVEDKSYPCNKTRSAILSKLDKHEQEFLTKELELKIWQLLYSVNSKEEIDKALNVNSPKINNKISIDHTGILHELKSSSLSDISIQRLKAINFEEKDYGSYSYKAIKKLLALMRQGKYFDNTAITDATKARINSIFDRLESISFDPERINSISDDDIPKQILKSFIKLNRTYGGFNTYQACYAVYGRHSEAKEIAKWEKPEDIDQYLAKFKQHSLRNPIVEQIITETLRVVRDIWKKHAYKTINKDNQGNNCESESELTEIHIELGRDMKNNKSERLRISRINSENENTNLRIRKLLIEFNDPEFGVENVRPHSPSQQEILRIYEDGVLKSGVEIPEYVDNIIKKFKETDVKKQPSKSEVLRYKLWLEQKYRSPYTNEVIPLGKLFTNDYQIEHIIPQSRYFDDSFSNKVICEAEVNQLKENELGCEFIMNNGGRIVELSFGKTVRILDFEAYEQFVQQNYAGNRPKLRNLLMTEIPNDFIDRQLNDSRYISKVVKGLLSNIVREDGEAESTSKNLISCTGGVTARLKMDWGLNDVWNNLIYPRFERLNELTNSNQFGYWDKKDGKNVFQTQVPMDIQKGFNKKRIDHRHHALDALVIACATRSHINYLNNESAKSNSKESRYDLRRKLRRLEVIQKEYTINGRKEIRNIEVAKEFYKPWNSFTQDAQSALENIVVSFKQNLRVINKTTNYFLRFNKEGKKIFETQTSGSNWAIRKPLHKDTAFGLVNLKRTKTVSLANAILDYDQIVNRKLWTKIKELISIGYDNKRILKYFTDDKENWNEIISSGIEVFYYTDNFEKQVATRKPLDTSFTESKIINSITDLGIHKILLAHLRANEGNPNIAFSPEGIETMNRHICELNGGKFHHPIYKVRVHEPLGYKFKVGDKGNRSTKYVEAAKGTNLFFGIYINSQGIRSYETIPLNVAIERQKQGLSPVPDNNELGERLLFWLSPNDLVYLPTSDEVESGICCNKLGIDRIYKMVSCTGYVGDFIPAHIANPIIQTLELGSNNKAQRAWTGEMIKEICIPVKVDRMGNIVEIFNRNKN